MPLRLYTGIVLCLFALLPGSSVAPAAEGDSDVIDGFVGRIDGLKSGKLAWTTRRTSKLLPELIEERIVVFSDGLWRADFVQDGVPVHPSCNRSDGSFETAAAHHDDKAKFKLLIGAQKPFYNQHQCGTWPISGGTVIHDVTRRYVLAHQSDIKQIGREVFQGIDCHILEMSVPEQNLPAATHVVCPSMVLGGGTMRFLVAPLLGFCIPRYEYRDSNGVVRISIESRDFVKGSAGVFFPRELIETWAFDGNADYEYHTVYSVVDRLNETIEPSELEVELQTLTEVRDTRPDNNCRYTMDGPPLSTAQLDDWLVQRLAFENGNGKSIVNIPRRSPWPWLISVNLAVGMLLFFAMRWSRRKTSV